MNIYHVSGYHGGYDSFSDFVCVAKSEEDARSTHPYNNPRNSEWCAVAQKEWESGVDKDSWIAFSKRDKLKVVLLGKADKNLKRGVVCASFHAG